LKHISCTITWKTTPFLPNNCLTRIQTIHRHFEAYFLYNSMKKYAFFAVQLFDKDSSCIFSQIKLNYNTVSVQSWFASPRVLLDPKLVQMDFLLEHLKNICSPPWFWIGKLKIEKGFLFRNEYRIWKDLSAFSTNFADWIANLNLFIRVILKYLTSEDHGTFWLSRKIPKLVSFRGGSMCFRRIHPYFSLFYF
jgi:hypothetical protein